MLTWLDAGVPVSSASANNSARGQPAADNRTKLQAMSTDFTNGAGVQFLKGLFLAVSENNFDASQFGRWKNYELHLQPLFDALGLESLETIMSVYRRKLTTILRPARAICGLE